MFSADQVFHDCMMLLRYWLHDDADWFCCTFRVRFENVNLALSTLHLALTTAAYPGLDWLTLNQQSYDVGDHWPCWCWDEDDDKDCVGGDGGDDDDCFCISTDKMTILSQHSFLNPLRLRVAKLLVLEAIFIGLIVRVKVIAKSITFLPSQNL